jgi:hypothetical protein
MGGTVLAEGTVPAIKWVNDETVEMSVPVGKMGTPAKVGEAPARLTAEPSVTMGSGTASPTGAIRSFDFKVVADLEWLSDRWLADRERKIADSGAELHRKCVDLKLALSEAWAQGKTDLMDQDPIDIIAPYVDSLKKAGSLPVKKQEEFSLQLWKNWLEEFAWEPASKVGPEVGDFELSDRNIDDDQLIKEIRAQCGPGADTMIAAATATGKVNALKKAKERYAKVPHMPRS